jgi:O-succinylhomoserine sulfhydrylase
MTAGGGLVAIEVAGGLPAGRRFLDTLKMCNIVTNLGDARTSATHPASTTHSALTDDERRAVGITPGLIRISVGLEHIDDIMADVDHALRN